MARVIAVANEKGGAGKTTVTLNLSATLAQWGYKVLMIDNDPQCNATTGCIASDSDLMPTMFEVYVNGTPISEAIMRTAFGFDLVPVCKDLAGAEKVAELAHPLMLRNALAEVLDRYDFIVIDHPPTVGFLVVNGLVAATEVLIPMVPEDDAYNGAKRVVELVRNQITRSGLNKNLEITGVLSIMNDPRLKLHQEVMEEAKLHFESSGIRFMDGFIKRSVRFAEAKYLHVPAVIAAVKSHAVQDFDYLVMESLGIVECPVRS